MYLYAHLLTDEAHQPGEKVVKAQIYTAPWEDLYERKSGKKESKTWTSFLDCITFHLQTIFCHDVAEAVKFYIMNISKKPYMVFGNSLCALSS